MKKIYIILTHTGTLLSRAIKFYTRANFSHVSIALDEELKQMYSFGRLRPYNPFIAGFVHEYIDDGTFKRFYKTKAVVYSLVVTDEQYKKLNEVIHTFEANKEDYKFNIIGLFAAGFNKKIRFEKSFYCAEFVKYVLEKSEIDYKLPEIVKPEDFEYIYGEKKIYSGYLRKYSIRGNTIMDVLINNLLIQNSNENFI